MTGVCLSCREERFGLCPVLRDLISFNVGFADVPFTFSYSQIVFYAFATFSLFVHKFEWIAITKCVNTFQSRELETSKETAGQN